MATGKRIILPEHIRNAENEPDPLKVLNDDQEGPLAGWLVNRLIVYGAHFAPSERAGQLGRVKQEIGLAYTAIRFAYDGVLPRVEQATIGEYFKSLLKNPNDDPFKTAADPGKLAVVRDKFKGEQTHLNAHIVEQLGGGVLLECGLTCIPMSLGMLEVQRAKATAQPAD